MPKTITVYIIIFFVSLLLSAIQPKEYFTCFLLVLPSVIGFAVLAFPYNRFFFSYFFHGDSRGSRTPDYLDESQVS